MALNRRSTSVSECDARVVDISVQVPDRRLGQSVGQRACQAGIIVEVQYLFIAGLGTGPAQSLVKVGGDEEIARQRPDLLGQFEAGDVDFLPTWIELTFEELCPSIAGQIFPNQVPCTGF